MDAIYSIFEFIYSIFDTIVSGIFGVVEIILSLSNLVLSLTRIIPSPMYQCLIAFVGLYITIFTYKIFRKG